MSARNHLRGSILIAALWMVVFFSALMMVLGVRARSDAFYFKKITEKTYLRLASYSGISKIRQAVMSYYVANPEQEGDSQTLFRGNWFQTKSPFCQKTLLGEDLGVEVGHYRSDVSGKSVFVLGLLDESARVNINLVSLETLKTIFLNAGDLTDQAAQDLAQAAVDWRVRQGSVAEGGNREVSEGGIGFGSVDELLVVPGMRYDIWNLLKDSLTVYGNGKINLNHVSAKTLGFLGVSSSVIERIDVYRNQLPPTDSLAVDPAFSDMADLTLKIGVSSEEFATIANNASMWSYSPEVLRFVSRGYHRHSKWGSVSIEVLMDKKGRILYLEEL